MTKRTEPSISISISDTAAAAPLEPSEEKRGLLCDHTDDCDHTAIFHGDHVGHLVDGRLECVVQRTALHVGDDHEHNDVCSSSNVHPVELKSLSDSRVLVEHVLVDEVSRGKKSCNQTEHSHRVRKPSRVDASPASSSQSCESHVHGPVCGHEMVPHGDHFDYLVENELHHPHDGHCDHHGRVGRAKKGKGGGYSVLSEPHSDYEECGVVRRRHRTNSTAVKEQDKKWYQDRDTMRFFAMFFLTGGFMFVEVVFGVLTDSLSLIADAMHMMSDVIALAVGFYAIRVKDREPTTDATFGWTRMEVIAALMNGTFLLSISFTITLDAIKRFIENEPSATLESSGMDLIIVASVGLVVNLVGLFIFGHGHGHGHSHGGEHGHSHDGDVEMAEIEEPTSSHSHSHNSKKKKSMNMNVHGVMLHILGDTLNSVAVVISGCIMEFTDWENRYLADPIASVIISIMIGASALPLVRSTMALLLHKVPQSLDMRMLHEELLECHVDVKQMHDFHIWSLSPDKVVGSLHVILREGGNVMRVTDAMKRILHDHGVHSTTIQPEYKPCPKHVEDGSHAPAMASFSECYDRVCDDGNCVAKSCCAVELKFNA